ncbi:MAG: hypothetical protein JXB04_09035, partial [Kiritimatiellae bacterium]|nr:hypothetical protein [Kiritimatiellia bacterium]
KCDCLDREDLTLHVAFMEDGDNGDGTPDEIYQELSAAVAGVGDHTNFWVWIPGPSQTDPDYISTPDGGAYIFAAWLEDASNNIVALSEPQATQLKWGVRPTAALPTTVAKGDHLEVPIVWEDLYEYLPWENTPISRNDAFPDRVAVFRSSKTEARFPGHFASVNQAADWLESMGYSHGNPLDLSFDNITVAGSFSDDFSDADYDGWARAAGCGNWTAQGGILRAWRIGNDDNMLALETGAWGDATLSADVRYNTQGPYFNNAEFYFRFVDRDNYYKVFLRNSYGFWRIMYEVKYEGEIKAIGILHEFAKTNSPAENVWYNLKVVAQGNTFEVYLDNNYVNEFTADYVASGRLAVGSKATQLGIWEPQKGYYFIDDDEYTYWAPEGQPTLTIGEPLNMDWGYLDTFFPTLILPGTYVMSDIEVSNIVTWLNRGLRSIIATDGGIAIMNEDEEFDIGRMEGMFGVAEFVYQQFENLSHMLIGPEDHYVTLDYEEGQQVNVTGNGKPWPHMAGAVNLATLYGSSGNVPALLANVLDDDPLVPKKVFAFNFNAASGGQLTNSLSQIARRAFEWARGEAFKVTLELKYSSGNPDLDIAVFTTDAWILTGSGETTLVVDLPTDGLMTGDNLYWVMYVHPWDADDAWLAHSGFYSTYDSGVPVSLPGQGLQILGITDRAYAGRDWDMWVAYNTTGETVKATYGVKEKGDVFFEDRFDDGAWNDNGAWLESTANFGVELTPEQTLRAFQKRPDPAFAKLRQPIADGIAGKNVTMEFDLLYENLDAFVAVLYRDWGAAGWPSAPQQTALPDDTNIWHHVVMHVRDGVPGFSQNYGRYDYYVNGDVVLLNEQTPKMVPRTTYWGGPLNDSIGWFFINGEFQLDNIRVVDEEYSVVPAEVTGTLVPTGLSQVFWASLPDYDPDKWEHEGSTCGQMYEWYIQFKGKGLHAQQETEVYFAPRLRVEETNFPTVVTPGTLVDVPVDWENLTTNELPARLQIRLAEPFFGTIAASADFEVTAAWGADDFTVPVPVGVKASDNYLWSAFLYPPDAADPMVERIGLDDTFRFDTWGLPIEAETEIAVGEIIDDPYVVYSDDGIPYRTEIFTWGSGTATNWDALYEDPTAPEGSNSFRTIAAYIYGAGWGIFKYRAGAPDYVDMSAFSNGVLCFWLKSSNPIKIELEGPQNTKRSVSVASTGGEWQEFVIPITNFAGVNLSQMYSLFSVNLAAPNRFYVDYVTWEGAEPRENTPPTVTAGPDRAVLFADGSGVATICGAVVDDGSPSNHLETVWSQESGPGWVSFDDPYSQHVGVTFPLVGTYVLRLTASDGELAAYDEASVLVDVQVGPVNEAPCVYAGADATTIIANALELNGVITDDGLPSNQVFAAWAKVSGPGSAVFGNVADAQTAVAFSEAGTYVLRLTGFDGQLSDWDDVTITVEPYTGTLIWNGECLAGSIDVAYEEDNYVFRGEAGDIVKIRMGDRTGSLNFDLVMTLRNPAGTVLTTASGEANAEIDCTLPHDGYYTITCRENDANTGGYALSMLWLDPGHEMSPSDPDLGVIYNGESLVGTINLAGDLDAAYFVAEAGDVVKIRTGDRTGSLNFDFVMQLYGPDGGFITNSAGEANAEIEYTVAASGPYTVVCRENDADTGSYALSLLWVDPGHELCPSDPDLGEIQNGDSLAGTINQAGDLDAAYFTAEAGDIVKIRMGDRTGSLNYDLVMQLYGPDGQYIAASSGEANAEIDHTVAESGVYTVVCRENDADAGGYALSILWLDPGHALSTNDADLGEIENGEWLIGTINQAGDLDAAHFTAEAGDIVKIRMGDRTTSLNYDLVMYLYGPDGVLLASGSGEANAEIDHTVAESGEYTVVCRENDADTGTYALSMLWLDPGHALSTNDADLGEIENGEWLIGTINQAGDLDAAYFTAEAGDIVKIRMGDRTGSLNFDLVMYLYGPDGALLASGSGEANAEIDHTVAASGEYTVVCRENDADTGTYALSMLWLDPGHALSTNDTDLGEIENGEYLVGTINQSGDLDAAHFTAEAGDVVKIRMGDRTGSLNYDLVMYLYGPDGALLASGSGEANAEIEHAVAESGTYTVVCRENDADTGSYALSMLWLDPGHALSTNDTNVGEIKNGECLVGTINQSGDLDAAHFAAEAGDVVKIRMGDRTGSLNYDLVMYLYGPDGGLLASGAGEANAEIEYTVAESGVYTVVCRENDADTGSYALSILWLDSGHELSASDPNLGLMQGGETVIGTINQAGDLDAGFFEAQQWATVTIRMADRTGSLNFDLYWALYDSDGQYVCAAAGEATAELTTVITNGGWHTVVCRENDADTGSYDLTITGALSNSPPIVSAGEDMMVELSVGGTLEGSVVDDGLPAWGTLVATWTKESGPGSVTFGDIHDETTTVGFSAAGVYVLRLTATDGQLETYDEVTVTVAVNAAPVVDAGNDSTIGLIQSANLDGTIADDGLPASGTLTSLWSKVSGPGDVTFDDSSAEDTSASFSAAGTYVLRIEADDGALTGSDTVTITVEDAGNQIGNGQTIVDSISTNGEVDSFLFTGAPGDVVYIRMTKLGGTFRSHVSLYDPDGLLVTYNYADNYSVGLSATLTKAGAYEIRCKEGYGTRTGEYTVAMGFMDSGHPLSASDPDITNELVNGSVVYGEMDNYGDIDTCHFQGVAGERVYIRMTKMNDSQAFRAHITLFDPDGVQVTYNYGDNYSIGLETTLQKTGTYTLRLIESYGTRTGPYCLTIGWMTPDEPLSPDDLDITNALVNGSVVYGNIDNYGDIDTCHFEGTQGEKVYIRITKMNDSQAFRAHITLYDPDGVQVT